MKKYYLFSERGTTERFFCGNIYEALPGDKIKIDGELISFEFAEEIERCKSFATRKEANDYSRAEDEAMEESNNYANRAMRDEEIFGMEGVDNCLNDY